MSVKYKAAPPPDSSSDDDSLGEEDETARKRIKLIRELAEQTKPQVTRHLGGIIVSSESELNAHSTSASLSAAEKKGLKEVEELERELDLKNTFSKETNRRDEDAEMKKYIDEQIRLRRLAAEQEREQRYKREIGLSQEETSELQELFTLPTSDAAETKVDDILLHQLVKNYSTTTDEKSEAMLSSQMLNGIPEVDLGLNERIRTIEATEEAKLRMVSSSSSGRRTSPKKQNSTVPVNYSTNYQHHRSSRDQKEGEPRQAHQNSRDSHHHRSSHSHSDSKIVSEPVVLVGEEPTEIELKLPSTGGAGERRPPPRGWASDDYYLQKFKKNSRR